MSYSHAKTIIQVDLFSFSLRKKGNFHLLSNTSFHICPWETSGLHNKEELSIWLPFLYKTSWKDTRYECDTFYSSKHKFFWDLWQDFDANTCPWQNQWVTLTCHQAVKPRAVPSIQGLHLYTECHDFLSGKVLFGEETLHNFEAVDNLFDFQKRKGTFSFDGISLHVRDKKQELAALKQNVSFIKETIVAAPWPAVKYQEKCQQVHSESRDPPVGSVDFGLPGTSWSLVKYHCYNALRGTKWGEGVECLVKSFSNCFW